MRHPPPPALCAVCDRPSARPLEGHNSPLCARCEQEWLRSGEHARAATARQDFVDRLRAEETQS
jgi:hypothetical protein